MKADWLIVGAGLTGATLAERTASQLDQKVVVIERRDHLAGNAYDFRDQRGILVHKYGPHVFHTNSRRVWDYLSRFTEWRPFYYHVRAVVDERTVPVPFNLNSLHALFEPSRARKLEKLLLEHYSPRTTVPVLELKEATNPDLRSLGQYVYEKLFHGYTLKQWDLKPEELSPSVTGRVPVSLSRDDRYFHDVYQGIPSPGYTQMVTRMLDHPNIELRLSTDYRDLDGSVQYDRMVYTGAIDEFFDRRFGALEYRSLRFEFACEQVEFHQEVGQVNYPNSEAYTRITEFKHITGQHAPHTTIAYEYPQVHVPGENEPYYPIPRDEYAKLYLRYHEHAEKLKREILFAGRLGEYKYYNMDQVVERALDVFEKEVAR